MTVDFTLCRQSGTKTSVITGTTSSLLLSNEPTRDGANDYFKLITQMIQIRLDPASVSMRRSVKCRFLDWLKDSRHVENAWPVQHIEIYTPVASPCTGWTRVGMSTPLLLEVAPEIDTNPTGFYRGGVGGLLLPLRIQKLKGFQLQGDFAPLTPWPGALPLDPAGDSASRPPL